MMTASEWKKGIEAFYRVRTVSGSETGGAALAFFRERLGHIFPEITADSAGNVIAVRRCGLAGAKKIALAAPLDEKGYTVTSLEPATAGELRRAHLYGTGAPIRERYIARPASIPGGASGTLVPDGDGVSFLFDDAGGACGVGDTVCPDDPPVFVGAHTVFPNALNDKIFCLCAVDAALGAADVPADLYLVFAAQHLLGGRGASAAAYTIGADEAVLFAPISGKYGILPGKGPAVAYADARGSCSPTLCAEAAAAAERAGIPLCRAAAADADFPSITAPFIENGAKTVLFGAPRADGTGAYDLRDLSGAAQAACAFLHRTTEAE